MISPSTHPMEDPITDPPPKRSRGAQPGNLNALKHGFYSRIFQDREALDLEALLDSDLKDEIAMLRVVIRRVLQYTEDVENLEDAVHLLSALGAASTRLASLLRVQKLLGGASEASDAISEALTQIVQDLNLDKRK
jgi:hypothetical protein